MFTYYLCDDNETIHTIDFFIKPEEKEYYLSLLENYLTELVFLEENESKKFVESGEVEKENKDDLSIDDSSIFLRRTTVTGTDKIEDYLPFVVTVKTKKYCFLRSYTIVMLIRLLSNELDQIASPYVIQIRDLLSRPDYIDFNLIRKTFLDQFGNVIGERSYDYHSLISLLRSLEVKITATYSKSALSAFWQGDEADRAIADGIVSDSKANKEAIGALKKVNKPFS